jgi:hypothetical protein
MASFKQEGSHEDLHSLEGFASFMAEAAMKNSAKAKLGDAAKIGPVRNKCEVKGLLYECNATARACK